VAKKLLFVFGTRPEAIKIAPVVAELRALGVEPDLLCTGQHTDLLDGSPARTELAGAENANIASDGSVTRWMMRARPALRAAFQLAEPACVVVQGDTMSALAAAAAASELGVPVAHIEAGVRSHDLGQPWPEEANRVEISKLALHHLAPTETAAANLVYERVGGVIKVTGNTAVSALVRYSRAEPALVVLPYVVVTLHRRESQPHANMLAAKVIACARVHPTLTFVWPLHPSFGKALGLASLELPPNLRITSPVGYSTFVESVAQATAVVTDSGGLVEEACTLGVPALIVRAVNDRPEAVEAGRALLVDPQGDLVGRFAEVLTLPRTPSAAYGTPAAAATVASYLAGLVRFS